MALWTPEYINTALWLDASDIYTITESAGAVSVWADKSGNGRDAVQATGTAQPVLTSAAINSLDAVTFDGSDDRLNISNQPIAGTTPRSIFAVVRPHTYGSLGGGFLALIATRTTDGSAWDQCIESDGFYIRVFGNAYWAPAPALNTPHLSSVVWAAGTIDNTVVFSHGSAMTLAGGSYRTVNTTTADAVVGATPSQSDVFFDGDIAEIIIIASAVDNATRQKIEGYLAHKWGLSTNLPTDHPYKSAAPLTYTISGIITGADGNPAARTVRTYSRSIGTLLKEITSDATTGAYELGFVTNDEIYRIVLADETTLYNDIIDRVIPG